MTTPLPSFSVTMRGQVESDWIDVNGHMSAGYFDRLFDRAEESLFTEFGIADPYILRTGLSYYRLERIVIYARELMQGDPLEVRSRVLWTDLRRVHHFHELWNTAAGYRAAYCDGISIHVDLTTRKSAVATLPEVTEPLLRLRAAHSTPPLPEGVVHRVNGRRVGP